MAHSEIALLAQTVRKALKAAVAADELPGAQKFTVRTEGSSMHDVIRVQVVEAQPFFVGMPESLDKVRAIVERHVKGDGHTRFVRVSFSPELLDACAAIEKKAAAFGKR